VLALLLMMLFLPQGSWAREKPAPVIEASGGSSVSGTSLEARVTRLERLNRALVDLMTRMDSLQKQMQQLQGQVEEQTYNMDELKKRQRDLYLDIDRRLSQLEGTRAAAPVTGGNMTAPMSSRMNISEGTAAPGTTAFPEASRPVGLQQEQADYESAFGLLREGRYDPALVAFKTFVQNYPNSRFAGNAQYWLGEANYVQHNFKLALAEFGKVVSQYPTSPKRADALLKMGLAYQELKQYDLASQTFNQVTSSYPNSTAASLAGKRLQELKRLP
jgi:tol-pal system protein YbgF